MAESMQEQLAAFLDGDAIVPPGQLDRFALDGSVPTAVVRPASRQAVAEIMRWASREVVSVFPWGGGTQAALGNVPNRVDLVLDLSRCARILDYQPADLTATVEAGVTLQGLQQELERGGEFLPVEAPLAERATIGGILAVNATGPLRSSYGLPRDWLIGAGVVSAEGVETKAGGKVVKNVTGYDLNKLYAGSLGTLAVIVEATFKLAPLPADAGALVAAFSSMPEGIEAGRRLLRLAASAQGVQVVEGQAEHRLGSEPGSLFPESLTAGGAATLAFFSGRPTAVRRRLEEGERLLGEAGATKVARLNQGEGRQLLRRLADLGWSADTRPYLGIKIGVPPAEAARVAGSCRQDSSLGFPPGVVADPGFGTVRLFWWADSISNWIDESLVLGAITRIRELARNAGGTAVVEHCPLPLKKRIDIWGDPPQGMELMRRVKQRFDPLGILNPGRFVGEI
ncbi:MAG: FAD-binding oxidoreductase [Dehalococcoidia bacterium]|nr:FAD-binding oxidoreductase [Dehalococcoidia bacterium]